MNEDNNMFDEEFADEGSFAEMLEESLTGTVRLHPGQKVAGKVLQIGKDWTFLDVGQKGEGVLDTRELLNEEGELTVEVGDTLEAYFMSGAGGELKFTTRLGAGATGMAQLEEAWRSGIPVDGRVEKEIKGGYEIKLAGSVRAFCPFSQMGLRRVDNPEELIDQSLPFRITRFGEQGRNIVVSHRAILEEERRQQREAWKQTLEPGLVVKGKVTSVRDFGAFIDIGGIEGLLPISEFSYSRVENLGELLQVGEELELAVKSIDWEQDRFSFSRRDTLADPWQKAGTVFASGSTHTGTVARLVPFGAFVTLEEGMDGLIHISRLREEHRIQHPKEVLTVGQQLLVTIESVDREERRISLAPAKEGAEEMQNSYTEQPDAAGMGTLGDLLKASLDKKRNG